MTVATFTLVVRGCNHSARLHRYCFELLNATIRQVSALHEICERVQLREEASGHRGLLQGQLRLSWLSPGMYYQRKIPRLA
jgi:hypothetical protein